MAVDSGVAPHKAFLNANGGSWPIEQGTVTQKATRESSSYDVAIPLEYPGAYDALVTTLDDAQSSIEASGPGGSGELIDGPISKIKVDYISGTISVQGTDLSVKAHQTKVAQKWMNQTADGVISQLVGQIGLGYSSDGGSGLMVGKKVENDYVKLADNVSAAYVIHKIAEFEGSRWWVKNGTFFFKKIGTAMGGGYSININPGPPIRSDCMLLVVSYDVIAGQTVNTEVKSYSPPKKQLHTGQATIGGRGGTLNYNYHVPNMEQDHAQQLAKAKAAEIARHEITIEATVVGDPSIDIGQGLTLSGTGVFDGSYELDRIIHTFGYAGYTMDLLSKGKQSGGGAGGNWGSPNAPEDQGAQTP